MNRFLTEDITKLSRKTKTDKVLEEVISGTAAGAGATAVVTPFSNVITQMENQKHIPWKRFIPEVGRQLVRPDTWFKIVPLKAIKMGATMGLTFGGIRVLRNLLEKRASIYTDFKLPPPKFTAPAPQPTTISSKKPKQDRWTPINAEARFIWSHLEPQQKRLVNTVVRGMTPRVRTHNKDYIITALGKGRNFDALVKQLQTNPDTVLK
jgi:hypothetical protein